MEQIGLHRPLEIESVVQLFHRLLRGIAALEGKAADIVIFDETTIAAAKKLHKASDLPGGASRLMVRSIGIDYTVVNGEVTWQDGALTGARAGQILRS